MTKIILINGSPRTNGATAKLLKAYQLALDEQQVETDLVHISRLEFSSCRGCCSCYLKGHCIFTDDASELSRKIQMADAFIIGSPTYSSQISGELKLFIDRGHFVIEQLLKDKYAITVTTGENYGNRAAGAYLDQLVRYSGGQVCGKLRLKLPFGSEPLISKKTEKVIQRQSTKLIRAIRQRRVFWLQKLHHRVIFRIGIRPFVERKGESYQGIRDRWRENGTERVKG